MQKIPKVILLIESSRRCGRQLLRGVARYSRSHGPWMFYRRPPSYMDASTSRIAFSRLKEWGANGIITRDSEKIDEIIAMGLPTIVARATKEPIPGLSNVVSDSATTAKMAAEHLLERGFKHFAYCGFDDMPWSRERGKSFGKRIAEAGFETHYYKCPRSRAKRSWENEQIVMADWLGSLPKPVGLMACADDRSEYVVEACKIAGLRVPDEVSIIGVDNDDIACDLAYLPLSSVSLNFERAGYEAAELLDKLMSGETTTNKTIIVRPTHIVTRQSTDIMAVEDSEVAEAVRFIRQHAKEIIQVSDVVGVVTVSRRSLERRFRRVLGRSVLDEIKRVRINQVAQMLVETNLSVLQIALALGYAGVENIARYFRQEKKMSPLAYRKLYGRK